MKILTSTKVGASEKGKKKLKTRSDVMRNCQHIFFLFEGDKMMNDDLVESLKSLEKHLLASIQ